jgi:aryl-alcohol dehydrogenase-like predicted oxidoreductase
VTGPTARRLALRIVRCVEDSLRRLQTDRIDLYQIHMQDLDTPEEETLRALDDLVRAGKVLYLGCSNYAAWRLMDSAHIAGDRGLTPFVSLQAQWSLIERGLERELVPACKRLGIGILPWSPLARGLLTGKYRRDQRPADGSRLTLWKDSLARDDNERNVAGDRRGGDAGRGAVHHAVGRWPWPGCWPSPRSAR